MEKIYKKINIIGCGFVGLTTGLGLAEKGHSINFIDIDKDKLFYLKKGQISFYEKGLTRLLKKNIKNKISFSSNLNILSETSVSFICVDTPSNNRTGKISLKHLNNIFKNLVSIKYTRKHLLVIKSTVIPGTTDMFYNKISNINNLHLSNNPEFLREGSALNDFLFPDRIIFGCYDKFGYDLLSSIYKDFKCKVFKFTPVEAEYSKYFSNIFFGSLISFANQFNDSLKINKNVNYKNILKSFSYDKRVKVENNKKIFFPGLLNYLIPGPGFGGSCFPKDINAFNYFLKKNNIANNVIKSVLDINKLRDKEIIKIINKLLRGKKNQTILIYGLAFKPESDDLRNSKSVSLYENLKKYELKYKKIFCIDPFIIDQRVKEKFNLIDNKKFYQTKIDLMIIMNNYAQLKQIKFNKIDGRVSNILDLRSCVDYKFEKTNLYKLGVY